MKRREFGGMLITAVAGLLVSGAALASGKKAKATAGAAASTAAATATSGSAFNPNSFYITITTFFPYPMAHAEYKAMVKSCRNVEASEKLVSDMQADGKILDIQSKLGIDQVITCYEFCDEKAFREYEARFEGIPGNSSKLKKELGFRSKREFKKTVVS